MSIKFSLINKFFFSGHFYFRTNLCIVSGPPPPPLPPPLKAPNHNANKSFVHQSYNNNNDKHNVITEITDQMHDFNNNNHNNGIQNHHNNITNGNGIDRNGNGNLSGNETMDSDSGLEVVEEPTLRPSDLVRGNHNRSMSIISGELKKILRAFYTIHLQLINRR